AVREALGNLVNNAVSYGDDGRILLSLVGNHETVSLKVFNTGPQIPIAEIPALFNALQRGEDIHPDENQTSLGLGLFIVQQIATAHDGQVRCTSSPEGTSFEILLPRDSSTAKKR
ncbi:MAG: HAMP domain-containing histidine kinase, partial [Alcaligenaceae bacterium]